MKATLEWIWNAPAHEFVPVFLFATVLAWLLWPDAPRDKEEDEKTDTARVR